jgi:hypothetical protein
MAKRFREQLGRLETMGMIRIAELGRPLRHAVKAEQQLFRLERQGSELAREIRLQRSEVQWIVVLRRQDT